MGNYNRDNKRPSGGSRFGDRDGGKPSMHRATCSNCGNNCEVPFKPTGSKPVFCSVCFEKQGNGGKPSRFGNDRNSRPRFEDRQMHDAVCAKCKKDCQVPFRPTSSKPVFCDNCFDKGNSNTGVSRDSGAVMEQIRMLNTKIDKIMEILIPKTATKLDLKTAVREVVKTKKAIVKKKAKVKKKVVKKKATKKKK